MPGWWTGPSSIRIGEGKAIPDGGWNVGRDTRDGGPQRRNREQGGTAGRAGMPSWSGAWTTRWSTGMPVRGHLRGGPREEATGALGQGSPLQRSAPRFLWKPPGRCAGTAKWQGELEAGASGMAPAIVVEASWSLMADCRRGPPAHPGHQHRRHRAEELQAQFLQAPGLEKHRERLPAGSPMT